MKWLEGGEKSFFLVVVCGKALAKRRCNTPEVPEEMMWRITSTTRHKEKCSECPEWGLGDCIAP
jgi:hypothetical protein